MMEEREKKRRLAPTGPLYSDINPFMTAEPS
jgi:hypothetical protein